MEQEKHAEPEVIYEGQVSDWTEHIPMLASPEGNEIADEVAREQAKELGFTPEEMALVGGSTILPPRDYQNPD